MVNINILVALTCEAKPLVKYFKLQRAHQYDAFSLFARDNIKLLVSGVGQINMAAACGWLAGKMTDSNQHNIWLNVGTAGHGSLDPGEGFVVNQVSSVNNRAHYPPLVADWNGQYSALETVDRPSQQYHEGLAFDMEAYAFYKVAQRFAPAELIQSYKVVSDNPKHSIEKLNAKKLSQLIDDQLSKIEHFSRSLSNLVQSVPDIDTTSSIQQIFKQFHFTETQKHQFKELWRRWQVLKVNTEQNEIDLSGYSNAKQLIKFLTTKLLMAPKI